jgi:cell surface protein SprA
MLSPFQARPNGVQNTSSGKLYINLGNVSEDVLRDSRNFFENGLPDPKMKIKSLYFRMGQGAGSQPVYQCF